MVYRRAPGPCNVFQPHELHFSVQPLPSSVIAQHQKAVEELEILLSKPPTERYYILSDVNLALEYLEWALGLHSSDLGTWQFYVKFLKDKGLDEALLNVYSRYCRLFVNDKDIRNEYLAKIKQLDSEIDVTKWWIDYIGIEKHFGSPEAALELLNMIKMKSSKSWSPRLSKFIETLSLAKVDIVRTSFLNVKVQYTESK